MGKEGKNIEPGTRQSNVYNLRPELRMPTIYTTCMQHKHRYVVQPHGKQLTVMAQWAMKSNIVAQSKIMMFIMTTLP